VGQGTKTVYKTEILGNIKICPACLQRSPAMLKKSQILRQSSTAAAGNIRSRRI